MRRSLLVLAVTAGCMTAGSGDVPSPDAGPPGCTLGISFSPQVPAVGQGELTLSAVLTAPTGFYTLSWRLTRDGADVPFDMAAGDDRSIRFTPTEAGIYGVTLTGSGETIDCTDAAQQFNVRAAGARSRIYRIRAVPTAAQGAPPQEFLREVWGGADYYLGPQSLDPGVDGSGQLTSGGAPQAGFIRVTRQGSVGPETRELFADATGQFDVRIAATGTYDMLVVPSSSSVAPEMRRNLSSSQIGGAFSITDGVALSGTVTDGSGAAVPNATVQVTVDSVPSTLGVTDGAGSFSLVGRAGAGAELMVTPDPSSGLPRLNVALATLSANDVLAVSYDNSLSVRSHSPVVTYSTSSPAAGARATWITATPIASAGSVAVNGGAAVIATGSVRVTAVAGVDGTIPSLSVVDAVYDVILEPAADAPAGEVPALTSADLTGGGSPGGLSFQIAATVQGTVLDDGGSAVGGARVSATGRGSLINLATASATATTASDGSWSLPLAPTGGYDLVITPPVSAALAPSSTEITSPVAGQTTSLAPARLDNTIELVGEVTIPGLAGPSAGVQLLLFCASCSDADVPLAQATTTATGGFVLRAPDPGVSP